MNSGCGTEHLAHIASGWQIVHRSCSRVGEWQQLRKGRQYQKTAKTTLSTKFTSQSQSPHRLTPQIAECLLFESLISQSSAVAAARRLWDIFFKSWTYPSHASPHCTLHLNETDNILALQCARLQPTKVTETTLQFDGPFVGIFAQGLHVATCRDRAQNMEQMPRGLE